MNETIEQLFTTYGEAVLRSRRAGFDERQLERWLGTFSISEADRYRILDGLLDYYLRWSVTSFDAGLRLGFTLSDNYIRRLCPEEP